MYIKCNERAALLRNEGELSWSLGHFSGVKMRPEYHWGTLRILIAAGTPCAGIEGVGAGGGKGSRKFKTNITFPMFIPRVVCGTENHFSQCCFDTLVSPGS